MLEHNTTKEVRIQRERDGTKVDLWLAVNSGILTLKIIEYNKHKSQTLVRLDAFYLAAEIVIELGFSEDILPYSYASNTAQGTLLFPYKTNVQAIITHKGWPIAVADDMAKAAQQMVGYFTGHPVTVQQMGALSMTDAGDTDHTVEMSDQIWTEPFMLADDCVFCEKMTDQTVVDRVAGFQWAMDKEVAGRFGAGMVGVVKGIHTPQHYEHSDTDAGRKEYHAELSPWYADHPLLLKVIPLIDLPHHLKRALCIQWNHIVRDYLRTDPRFVYQKDTDIYYWMNVDGKIDEITKRIIPSIKSRSNREGETVIETAHNLLWSYGWGGGIA